MGKIHLNFYPMIILENNQINIVQRDIPKF